MALLECAWWWPCSEARLIVRTVPGADALAPHGRYNKGAVPSSVTKEAEVHIPEDLKAKAGCVIS